MLSRRAWLGMAAGGGAIALLGGRWWRTASVGVVDAGATPIIVYASPGCECCHKWVDHLTQNNFKVTVENVDDVTPIKRKLSVPETLWSCHTGIVEGFAIEGHVPADLVEKVLKERPAIAGLAAPGMPRGSPGMEGGIKERYEIVAFTRDGASQVYAVRRIWSRSIPFGRGAPTATRPRGGRMRTISIAGLLLLGACVPRSATPTTTEARASSGVPSRQSCDDARYRVEATLWPVPDAAPTLTQSGVSAYVAVAKQLVSACSAAATVAHQRERELGLLAAADAIRADLQKMRAMNDAELAHMLPDHAARIRRYLSFADALRGRSADR